MPWRNIPIRKKLLQATFLINGIVLILTCIGFFLYEYQTFHKTNIKKTATIGRLIAANFALAQSSGFDIPAGTMLESLKAYPLIAAATMYDSSGRLIGHYQPSGTIAPLPFSQGNALYAFRDGYVEGSEAVMHGGKQLGTLHIRSIANHGAGRLYRYGVIMLWVLALTFVLTYLLVHYLTKRITTPILSLARAAAIIHAKQDYSVRAQKLGNDEAGALTDAFNQMLDQIEKQNQALKEFAEKMEEKVKERTIQLEYANKEMESFSYSVSHDLRAPLRAIMGYTSILEEGYAGQLDAEGKRITSVIRNNTMRMNQLIDDLLAFSRMSRVDMRKAHVDMNEMVQDVKDMLAVHYDFDRIQWHIHPLPPAWAHATTLRQVWTNLLSNAIKYSGRRERAHIEIGALMDNHDTVYYVKDNGVGFNPAYAHKLFRIFQRLHSRGEFEGTGVGLASVEKIISKHGGKVWAEAEENKGAAFYFSLPPAGAG